MKKLILFIFILETSFLYSQDRLTGKHFTTRSEVIAQNGMVATSQPLATQAALDILKMGGSAVDAAIAANAVLGLVEPMSCGIGGDLFAIVWDAKSKKLYGLNASGRSPKSLTLQMLLDRGLTKIPIRGVLPISIPGCVDGWIELHEKFGRLSIDKVLEPAIVYAEKGFPVSEIIAFSWQSSAEYLKDYPGFREVFMPNGKAPQKGEIFKNPALANTYKAIAKNSRTEFYKGKIAEDIVSYVKIHKGYLELDDLASHRSEWVEPVSTNYRGYDVWELPPNGQGIAALQMLNILEQYDLKSWGFGSADYLHHLIEAKKIVYEDRAKFYSDQAFNEIPFDKLISKKYAAERKANISSQKAASAYTAGKFENGDTIYLTVADKDGNMVSLIQSNFWSFGSGIVSPKLGFALQNRGNLFALDSNHFNCYAPGKRPFHTIIPAFIIKDGKPYISFGVMGGSMQPQGHVQVIINLIDFEMNLQEAGDAPRMRHTGSSQPTGSVMKDGGFVNLESGFSPEVIRELINRGHHVQSSNGGYGGYQAIMFDWKNGVYYGASESRKDGQAAGY